MDCFSEHFLENYIKRSKLRNLDKLKKFDICEEELPLYSDLLCATLDYSPKIHRNDIRNKLKKKFSFEKEDEDSCKMKISNESSKTLFNIGIGRKTSFDESGEKKVSSMKFKISEIESEREKENIISDEGEGIVRSILSVMSLNFFSKKIAFTLKTLTFISSPSTLLDLLQL